jgi:hypothetical protein
VKYQQPDVRLLSNRAAVMDHHGYCVRSAAEQGTPRDVRDVLQYEVRDVQRDMQSLDDAG